MFHEAPGYWPIPVAWAVILDASPLPGTQYRVLDQRPVRGQYPMLGQ